MDPNLHIETHRSMLQTLPAPRNSGLLWSCFFSTHLLLSQLPFSSCLSGITYNLQITYSCIILNAAVSLLDLVNCSGITIWNSWGPIVILKCNFHGCNKKASFKKLHHHQNQTNHVARLMLPSIVCCKVHAHCLLITKHKIRRRILQTDSRSPILLWPWNLDTGCWLVLC